MSATFTPPARDEKFCTVVLPVLAGTAQIGRTETSSLYVCAKAVPCPDHPQRAFSPASTQGGEGR